MTSHHRHGAVLTKTSHTSEDESRVGRAHHVRADAETFAHAGPERIDQHVGAVDELAKRGHVVGILQVKRYGALAPCERTD